MIVGTTIKALLASAQQELAQINTARLDAEVLLAAVLMASRESLYAYPEKQVPPPLIADFQSLIMKRADDFPVAYLTGSKEFWSTELMVNQYTLIPRPETESLVETALDLIAVDADKHILDLGTGSGAIGIAVAKERRLCHIISSDISIEALAVAEANANRQQLTNIEFKQSDWFSGLQGDYFDLILCNPPYIDSEYVGFIDTGIRFEPRIALDGGYLGIQTINTIIPAACKHLNTDAYMILEHGYNQADVVRRSLTANKFVDARTIQDYAGLDRVSYARYP